MWIHYMAIGVWFVCLSNGQSYLDYHCSAALGCECATLPDDLTKVQLVCITPFLTPAHNMSLIPTSMTTWLTIGCNLHDWYSVLEPNSFEHLTELQELAIYSCKFFNLTNNMFTGLTNLKKLVLENIGIPSTHMGVFAPLANMHTLHITFNAYLSFPKLIFCGLNNLEHLNISYNMLGDANDIGLELTNNEVCLPKLTVLDISGNFFTSFMLPLANALPELEQVYMKSYPGGTRIKTLSSKVFKGLTNLTVLDLSSNAIEVLPKDLFNGLSKLHILFLASNGISYIDKYVFQDNQQLRHLDISGNNIGDYITTQGVLDHLSKIEYLDLSENTIITLPLEMLWNMTELQTLKLSKNNLSGLGQGMFERQAKLKVLDLSENTGIQEILNVTFLGLNNIEDIRLSKNYLVKVEDGSLLFTNMLHNLDLSHNRLERIPNIFSKLTNLNTLDLRDNLFTEINPDIFQGLTSLIGLRLSQNRFTYIPKNAFVNCPNLDVLNLAQNNISTLEYGAFSGLPNLRYLKLEHNQISDIKYIFTFMPSLIVLMLAHNKIKGIDQTMLPTSIFSLDLSFNHLSIMGTSTFQRCHTLYMVNLTSNHFTYINKQWFPISPDALYRPIFYLRGNNLMCNCRMLWLKDINSKPKYAFVQDLDLVYCVDRQTGWHYPITSDNADDFVCNYTVDCMSISCPCCWATDGTCPCLYHCPESCYCFYDNSRSFNVINCTGRDLDTVPRDTHADASTIMLDGNNLTVLSNGSFKANPFCHTLFLNNSNIDIIEHGAFHGLLNLKDLYLHNNNIKKIYLWMFNTLVNLNLLNLGHNNIDYIDNSSFTSLYGLQILNLHNNQLKQLPLDIMFENVTLIKLTIARNTWICDCELGPGFKQWVISQGQIVIDSLNITCIIVEEQADYDTNARPSIDDYEQSQQLEYDPYFHLNNDTLRFMKDRLRKGLEKKPIIKYLLHENFDFCEDNTTIINYLTSDANKALQAGLISVGIVFILAVTITMTIYNTKELIKIWLFAHYGLRFRQPQEDNKKHFDAFISYSSKDEHLVVKQLAPVLEKRDPKYKLCVHYRDWKVGACIADTVIESVEKSKRTIIILSDNFVHSEWCQYEFKTAHYQVSPSLCIHIHICICICIHIHICKIR